jgi:hypothetical protein
MRQLVNLNGQPPELSDAIASLLSLHMAEISTTAAR